MPPWLSIVMPTYNAAHYLRSTLESIPAAHDGIEIIVVDDGSTDETARILESFASRLPITFVERGHTGNWVANTNLGMRRARGEFVGFLHQDDRWLEGRLPALRQMISGNPGIAMYIHSTWYIDSAGRRTGQLRCPLPGSGDGLPPEAVLGPLIIQNFVPLPSLVFPRALGLSLGGLDEGLRYTADWEFCIRLAASGKTLYRPWPLCEFRIHSSSQTSLLSRQPDTFREQMMAVLERHGPDVAGRSAIPNVLSIGRFSAELNVFMASVAHGSGRGVGGVARGLCWLGPSGLARYLRYSRVLERVAARVRAGLLAQLLRGAVARSSAPDICPGGNLP